MVSPMFLVIMFLLCFIVVAFNVYDLRLYRTLLYLSFVYFYFIRRSSRNRYDKRYEFLMHILLCNIKL